MDVYTYVAVMNPAVARDICKQLGYAPVDIRRPSDYGAVLRLLVKEMGEPAFKMIMANHPDRDIIVSMFGNEPAANKEVFTNADGDNHKPQNYGCVGCKGNNGWSNASGNDTTATNAATANSNMAMTAQTHAMSLTSVAIIGAALLFATAIIVNGHGMGIKH